MNVAFNPNVNFKSGTNLIAQAVNKMPEPQNEKPITVLPSSSPITQKQSDVFEREANEESAQYIKQRKEEYENAVHKGFEDKFGRQEDIKEPKVKEYTQAELDEKANIFAERLSNREWKKEYLPENDMVVIRQKKVEDGTQYMIKNDGTVLETGLRNKPLTIIDPSIESAKTFAKYKSKLDPNAPKKSLWMMGKEAVAGIWKFFTVTGTLAKATARGLWQGAITGAAVLASSIVLRGTKAVIKKEIKFSDIFKHPMKTAGLGGKLLALSAGGLVLTGHIVAGKLKANQKSAVIEHKVDVPHEN